jgi:hypothetical protein
MQQELADKRPHERENLTIPAVAISSINKENEAQLFITGGQLPNRELNLLGSCEARINKN